MKLPKNWTYSNKFDRKKLSEGRNFGFGGAFVKRENDNHLEAVMSQTACGDFYSEVIHSEHSGKSWTVYGLHYSKQNIFDEKNGVAYMVCSILKVNNGGKYTNYDRDCKVLDENYQNLQTFLNWFEKKLKIKKPTQIIKLENNLYLFIVPLFWCQGTYLISLYKFLSRAGLFYTDGSPLNYLDTFEYDSSDKYMWNSIKPKLEKMLSGFIPEQKMTTNDSCPHNLGIVTYKFDTASKLYPKPIKINKTLGEFNMVKMS